MIAATPAAHQFLASQLLIAIATRSYDRRRWTLRRIASYITGSADIEGTVSATTLSRFLNPDHPQQASPHTICMVSDFLLHMNYVRRSQLDWAGSTRTVQAGLSMAQFYAVPETQAQRRFQHQLQGHFVAERQSGPRELRTRLILNFFPGPGLLLATEVLSLFSVHSASATARSAARDEDNKIIEYTATGQVLAGADIFAVFLKGEPSGLSSILNIDTLNYEDADEDERPIALSGSRNTGWTGRSMAALNLPQVVLGDTPARKIIQVLSNNPRLIRVEKQEVFARAEEVLPDYSGDSRDFVSMGIEGGELPETVARRMFEEESDPNARLLIARDWNQPELFKRALEQGADPNFIPTGEGQPVLSSVCQNGNFELTQILLDDPRLVIEPDEDGLWPSFHAGLKARNVAGVPGAEDIAKQFGDMHRLLVEHEKRFYPTEPETDPAP